MAWSELTVDLGSSADARMACNIPFGELQSNVRGGYVQINPKLIQNDATAFRPPRRPKRPNVIAAKHIAALRRVAAPRRDSPPSRCCSAAGWWGLIDTYWLGKKDERKFNIEFKTHLKADIKALFSARQKVGVSALNFKSCKNAI